MQTDQVIGGRYRIIGPLGEGGMANVYKARDLILDRDVALKIMRLDMRDDPIVQKRFENEIRASTELVHPNITQVYDYGDEDGNQYLVTEYVAGPDLKRYERDNYPMPLTKVVDIMGQILSGVQEAHNHGIIHRDLKPQNILMTPDGTAKITDFGIARAQSSFSMTQTNMAIGSVHYMAPEQVRGEAATPQSDIYSLGIMLYELLAGKLPFDGETSVAVAVKHTTDPMPLVRDSDPRVPQALENVILKATDKDPLERYNSASAMREDLATALSPDRVNEKRWVSPSNKGQNAQATKIMAAVPETSEPTSESMAPKMATAMAPQTEAKRTAKTQSPVDPEMQKKKRIRRRWALGIVVMIATLFIGLTIYGTQEPKATKVPDLNGSTLTEAKKDLNKSHLKLGHVSYKDSDAVKAGKIMSVKPQTGQSVKRGTKIDLILSSGSRKVRFGDYRNEAFESVADRLKVKGYTITTSHEHSDSVPSGYIMKQSIDPDKRVVPSKTTVNFVISMGPTSVATSNVRTPSEEPNHERAHSSMKQTEPKASFSRRESKVESSTATSASSSETGTSAESSSAAETASSQEQESASSSTPANSTMSSKSSEADADDK